MVKISSELYRGLYLSPKKIFFVRGGIKKTVFFYFLSNRGGGLGEYKKSLSENTKTFLTNGGVLPNPKGFLSEKLRFFGKINKKGGLYKKTGIFFTNFRRKRGVSANPKNHYQKKLRFFGIIYQKRGVL